MSSKFLEALAGSRLYPITDTDISGLSHEEQIRQLAAAGAKVVQLRDKTSSPIDFYSKADAAIRVARQHGLKVIVNDRVDIALALSADGVHVGQDDLPPAAARKLLGPDAIIGFSTHNPAQARDATRLPIDYIAIGPIFSTVTKSTAEPQVGLETLKLVRHIAGQLPVVAIGGISLENRQSVFAAGADAVAVIGDIWRSSQTVTEQLKSYLHA